MDMTIDMATLFSMSLLAAAGAAGLLAWPLVRQWRQRRATTRTLDAAPGAAGGTRGGRAGFPSAAAPTAAPAASPAASPNADPTKLGARFGETWLNSKLGRAVVTAEEQRLLEQCGYYGVRPRAVFGGLRVAVPVALALAVFAWRLPVSLAGAIGWGFATFAVGFLLPKLALRRRAGQRLALVADELPVLIDMLRLLQGVGLSIDQSLQIIVVEFGSMLHVLGPELQRANQQFASGRSREQTLLRIGKLFDDEDLKGLITLLTQVDRHGGRCRSRCASSASGCKPRARRA